MATLTGGRTARSTLPACDTPQSATVFPPHAAEAAWRSVTPSIAGTPHVRVSRDGGRTYPARRAGPLPAAPRTSRVRCRFMTRPRPLAGCWPWTLTLAGPATVPTRPPRSSTRRPGSASCSSGSAAGASPTSRRPAAATSTSCSPRRCRGSSCATSPAPWRSGSPRSTRRRCPASAARSALLDARHKSGGWRRALDVPEDGHGGRRAPERAGGMGRAAGRARGRAAPHRSR